MSKENIINYQAYKNLRTDTQDLSDLEEMNEQYFEDGIARDGNIFDASDYFLHRHHEQSLRENIKIDKQQLHNP